jgi:pimeloyl-[acyl-carrier protein] methyl ester esterase
MSLYNETHGSGSPLLLIHGWGMHGGFWDNIVPRLAERFCVHCVDLPGYGFSPPMNHSHGTPASGMAQLDEIVNVLAAQFVEPLTVCGWSLGGQVAMRWAQIAPLQIQKLVLVATTPCFAQREDWQYGMASETLHQFADELEKDYAMTLRRFLALLVRGSDNERVLLNDMRARLFSRGEPDLAALRTGLEILREVDLRSTLSSIRQPALIIAGEKDKLTPPEASEYLVQKLPNSSLTMVAGAAHVPFLSHTEIFLKRVTDFLHE